MCLKTSSRIIVWDLWWAQCHWDRCLLPLSLSSVSTLYQLLTASFHSLQNHSLTLHNFTGRRCKQPTRFDNFFRLLFFLNQPYMFRATNSPILRSTFLTAYTVFGTMHRHGCLPVSQWHPSAASWCIVPKAVYIVKKCSWGWANLSPETCRADLKNNNRRKSCCILLVAYIVVVMHAHTNVNFLAWFGFFIYFA